MIGLIASLWPAVPARPTIVSVTSPSAPVAALTPPAPDRILALPPTVVGVDLAAIPDRLLNDPPAARLRVPILVRGTRGIGSVDAPSEISWTEAGYWYWMRSKDMSVAQLVDLAGALQ